MNFAKNECTAPKTGELLQKRMEIVSNKMKIQKNGWISTKTDELPEKRMNFIENV